MSRASIRGSTAGVVPRATGLAPTIAIGVEEDGGVTKLGNGLDEQTGVHAGSVEGHALRPCEHAGVLQAATDRADEGGSPPDIAPHAVDHAPSSLPIAKGHGRGAGLRRSGQHGDVGVVGCQSRRGEHLEAAGCEERTEAALVVVGAVLDAEEVADRHEGVGHVRNVRDQVAVRVEHLTRGLEQATRIGHVLDQPEGGAEIDASAALAPLGESLLVDRHTEGGASMTRSSRVPLESDPPPASAVEGAEEVAVAAAHVEQRARGRLVEPRAELIAEECMAAGDEAAETALGAVLVEDVAALVVGPLLGFAGRRALEHEAAVPACDDRDLALPRDLVHVDGIGRGTEPAGRPMGARRRQGHGRLAEGLERHRSFHGVGGVSRASDRSSDSICNGTLQIAMAERGIDRSGRQILPARPVETKICNRHAASRPRPVAVCVRWATARGSA
jgi:hypothetical protein